jgi:hypothetical protein
LSCKHTFLPRIWAFKNHNIIKDCPIAVGVGNVVECAASTRQSIVEREGLEHDERSEEFDNMSCATSVTWYCFYFGFFNFNFLNMYKIIKTNMDSGSTDFTFNTEIYFQYQPQIQSLETIL